jgi:hypothetical protein
VSDTDLLLSIADQLLSPASIVKGKPARESTLRGSDGKPLVFLCAQLHGWEAHVVARPAGCSDRFWEIAGHVSYAYEPQRAVSLLGEELRRRVALYDGEGERRPARGSRDVLGTGGP